MSRERTALRENNNGFSLVEIVCAVAVIAIVCIAVSGLMATSAKTYTSSSAEIAVQQDSQLVASIIEELLVDADAGDDGVTFASNVLTVKRAGGEYTLTYDPADANKPLTYSDGSTTEVIAEGIEDFDVDVSDYKDNGLCKVRISMEKNGGAYESTYSITSRNAKAEGVGVEDGAAVRITVANCVAEPGQRVDLPEASVTGSTMGSKYDDPTGKNSDGTFNDYQILSDSGSRYINKISVNEISNYLTIPIETNEKVEGSSTTPLASTSMKAYVRRVNGFKSFTNKRDKGAEGKKNSEYTIEAQVTGSNLDYKADCPNDSGYNADDINKLKGITWEIAYVHNGKLVSHPELYFTLTPTGPDSSGKSSAKVTLLRDMESGDRVIVYAKAQRPIDLGYYDESVHMKAWVMKKEGTISPEGGHGALIERGTDTSQGNASEMNNWKVNYQTTHGNIVCSLEKYYRYRELGTIDPITGISTTAWTEWRKNPQNTGDNDVNLRPSVLMLFDSEKDYEIQTITCVIDNTGKIVKTFDPIDGEIDRVLIKVQGGGDGVNINDTKCNVKVKLDKVYNFDCKGSSNIKWDNVNGKLTMTLQIKDGANWRNVRKGEAMIVGDNNDFNNKKDQDCYYSEGRNNFMLKFTKKAEYRVLIGGKNIEDRQFISTGSHTRQVVDGGTVISGSSFTYYDGNYTSVYHSYTFGNEATGDGIFYFDAK